MKFFILTFFLLPSLAFCSELDVRVAIEWKKKNGKPKAIINLEIANNSKKEITVDDLNGDLIGCEIELWSLGKGVKVRQKTDAEWRREQAFASWGVKKLMPSQKLKYSFKLKELLPDDPANDDFSNSIIKNIEFLLSGKGQVNIEYRIKGEEEARIARKPFEINE